MIYRFVGLGVQLGSVPVKLQLGSVPVKLVMIGTNNGGRDEKGIATAVMKIVDVIRKRHRIWWENMKPVVKEIVGK